MSKKVIIEVLPTGEVKMQAKGFKGRSCLAASKPFREALGIPDEAVEPTSEMYQVGAKSDVRAVQKNGS